MPDELNQDEATNLSYANQLKQDAQLCYNAICKALTIPLKSYCERRENIEIDISLKKCTLRPNWKLLLQRLRHASV